MTDYRESITSKLCAFARAWHSNKARNKIFDDYLAYDFMGMDEYQEVYEFIRRGFKEDGELSSAEYAEDIVSEYLAPIPLSRAGFCESRLERFAEEHGEIQYVILGAGNDTFSFRCDNENIRIFEIDHPVTQASKLHKIRKLKWNVPDNVRFVQVDFEKERMGEKLLAAGFDPEKKAFFSILGVSYYLTLPVFTETIAQISELSRLGSVLVFDFPLRGGEFPPRVQRLEQLTHSLGEDMRGGFTYQEISRLLFFLGFQIDEYLNPKAVQARYFKDRTDGLRAFENVSMLSAVFTGGTFIE
ncbi:MAG: class I SAM-dependent methyltransferase [Oscillospiraceae bacterium]